MRILLTTTSYQDTPGRHHRMLEDSGHDVVRERGPLPESRMLDILRSGEGFDGLLHGDDALTRPVLEAGLPRLKVLSKYGIGLDSIDVEAATELGLPVLFTPGVNHTTVAEHAFGLMLSLLKHLPVEIEHVRAGRWTRITGHELAGKTLGVLGLGRIGREVVVRARAFAMEVVAFDPFWDDAFAEAHQVQRAATPDAVVEQADVLSLHMNLTAENRSFINAERIERMRPHAIVINCARGGLVDEPAVADACRSGRLAGYAADVLSTEPIAPPHPFQELENVLITPHIGSRTFESVERQAVMATENLLRVLRGEPPLAQANQLPGK